MRRRLYFLLPDVESARRTADDLLLARVEDRHMHFLARRGTDLAELHEAGYLIKTDFLHGAGVGLGLGAQAGSDGTRSTGHTGPATAVTRMPVRPSPVDGAGQASSGGVGPASDRSVTVPSGATANSQVCSSMQPAMQSPQPTRIDTRNAPTPDAGITSYHADWPMRS